MAFWASSSLSISPRFLTSAMNCSPFTRRSLLQRVLDSVLQHEGDLQVHLVALYVAVLDHDILILDQALSTFLRVLLARAMPCWMASSNLVSETALVSVTVATLILLESPLFRMLAHYYCLHFCLPP